MKFIKCLSVDQIVERFKVTDRHPQEFFVEPMSEWFVTTLDEREEIPVGFRKWALQIFKENNQILKPGDTISSVVNASVSDETERQYIRTYEFTAYLIDRNGLSEVRTKVCSGSNTYTVFDDRVVCRNEELRSTMISYELVRLPDGSESWAIAGKRTWNDMRINKEAIPVSFHAKFRQLLLSFTDVIKTSKKHRSVIGMVNDDVFNKRVKVAVAKLLQFMNGFSSSKITASENFKIELEKFYVEHSEKSDSIIDELQILKVNRDDESYVSKMNDYVNWVDHVVSNLKNMVPETIDHHYQVDV